MPITGTDFAKKWAIKFADNEFQNITEGTFREFTADVKLLCENVTAPTTATGDVAVVALKLPINVFVGGWYFTDTGVWEALQAFNAQAAPKPGPWWRLIIPFSTDSKVSVANITDATEAGRKMLLAVDAAAQLGLVDKLSIKAGDYGQHPDFTTAYGGDGNLGLLVFLLQAFMTLKGMQTVSAPSAPTGGQVDDTSDTLSGILVSGFKAVADYEVFGALDFPGIVNASAAGGDVQNGRIISRGLKGNIMAGGAGIRVAASGCRPAGAWMLNDKPFTGSAVVVTPPQVLTAALTISVATIVAGNALTFTVAAGGGTAPYSYAVVATNNATGTTTVLGSSASGSFTPQVGGTTYNIDATVTDAAGKVEKAITRTVTVTAPQSVNQLPVANAGQNLTITAPTSSAALLGTASDPDPGDTLTYLWRPIAGPNTPLGLPATTLNVVVSGLVVGEYHFGFTATDQKGGKSQESFVVVTVGPAASGTAKGYQATYTETAPDPA